MADREAAAAPPCGIPPDGFRLPAGTRPGAVRLQIADLERSLAYYQRVLGLAVLDRSPQRASLGVEGGDDPLVELRQRPGAAPPPTAGRPGLYHYAILLPDRASLGRFARHLSDLREPAGAADHGVSEALYLRDPDGLGIEVYADRPRSEWRQRGRELVMTTDPLDLVDVIRAGGDERWRRVPSGTAMGHVHLHVGDLERARSFYHEALGLDRMVWSYPGALFLAAGGYHHHLGLNTWARATASAGQAEARLLEWELRVPGNDVAAAALANLRAAGYGVEPDGDGGRVRDPWGTVLRIRADPSSA